MTNPFTQDPIFDAQYPPRSSDIHFRSHGALLNGVVYVAAHQGPHPTVLLLHGFPGNERNFDLAHLYRRAGFNTVVFHYRGSWGSEGNFSFSNSLADVSSALEFVRSAEVASKYRIDTKRVALVGHSMGGWAALMTAARDLNIRTVILICGFNFGMFAKQVLTNEQTIKEWSEAFQGELDPLKGATGQGLIGEVLEHGEAWNLVNEAKAFTSRPVMLIGGERDNVSRLEVSHIPLFNAFQESRATVREVLYDTDHSLASHRVALARDTLEWLQAYVT
jgi:uncharacterized protein